MVARAILFDVDGTLWDSYPWYGHVLETCGRISAAETIRRLRAGESIIGISSSCGVSKPRLLTLCRDNVAELHLHAGVAGTLEELAARSVLMGAVTSLPGELVDLILKGCGIYGLFGAVVHANNCAARKPSPEPLRAALRLLGIPASPDVWYVGDIESDALSAQRAGLSFAWASFGYGCCPPSTARVHLCSFAEVLGL